MKPGRDSYVEEILDASISLEWNYLSSSTGAQDSRIHIVTLHPTSPTNSQNRASARCPNFCDPKNIFADGEF